MLSFLQFLAEALTPIPGNDKGFEALHDLGDGHKVYLQFGHTGNGNHKVRAVYIPPGREIDPKTGGLKAKVKGTYGRDQAEDMPDHIRHAATARVFADVKHFVHHNEWNKLSFGGTDKINKEMYRRVMTKMADQSGGKYRYEPIPGAGARLVKNAPAYKPVSSGVVEKPAHDPVAPYRKGIGRPGYGPSDNSSSRSSGVSLDALSGNKSAPSGKWGPSGWKKNKGGSEKGGAAAGSESGESSGASAESSGSSA